MQNVKFRNIDDFLEYLPEDEFVVVNRLRQIIKQTLPECSEKLSYNVPFFKQHYNLCFLWPASVLWGKKPADYKGVRLGFTSGHLLDDEWGYLEAGKRKYVRCRDFTEVTAQDVEIIRTLLFEAAGYDEEKALEKGKIKRSN